MTAEQIIRTYPADVASLKALEDICNQDEISLGAALASLELATENGLKTTIGKYELRTSFSAGKLLFEEYATQTDIENKKAVQQAKGNEFLFAGKVYIGNVAVTVCAFGPHGGGDTP